MAKKNNSFKNFISKLESIDIQDLYKKAQSIKVEDIRNIKWKNPYGSGKASVNSYKIIKNFIKKNHAKFY